MTSQCWNIVGLVLMFIGIVDLFFFGMPYRVRRAARVAFF